MFYFNNGNPPPPPMPPFAGGFNTNMFFPPPPPPQTNPQWNGQLAGFPNQGFAGTQPMQQNWNQQQGSNQQEQQGAATEPTVTGQNKRQRISYDGNTVDALTEWEEAQGREAQHSKEIEELKAKHSEELSELKAENAELKEKLKGMEIDKLQKKKLETVTEEYYHIRNKLRHLVTHFGESNEETRQQILEQEGNKYEDMGLALMAQFQLQQAQHFNEMSKFREKIEVLKREKKELEERGEVTNSTHDSQGLSQQQPNGQTNGNYQQMQQQIQALQREVDEKRSQRNELERQLKEIMNASTKYDEGEKQRKEENYEKEIERIQTERLQETKSINYRMEHLSSMIKQLSTQNREKQELIDKLQKRNNKKDQSSYSEEGTTSKEDESTSHSKPLVSLQTSPQTQQQVDALGELPPNATSTLSDFVTQQQTDATTAQRQTVPYNSVDGDAKLPQTQQQVDALGDLPPNVARTISHLTTQAQTDSLNSAEQNTTGTAVQHYPLNDNSDAAPPPEQPSGEAHQQTEQQVEPPLEVRGQEEDPFGELVLDFTMEH